MATDSLSPFAPKWTWRSTLIAATVTLGLYLLLPALERLSKPPQKTVVLRDIAAAHLPPPAPPPQKRQQKKAETKPKTPQPELQPMRSQLEPLRTSMNLTMALGDIGGDFSVDFGVDAPALSEQVQALVFEIDDLDELPKPLTPLKPIYPTRASRRKIEGHVQVEFILTADGTVRDIKVLDSEPAGIFDNAAMRAIENWRLAPGQKDGKAVSTRIIQTVDFHH